MKSPLLPVAAMLLAPFFPAPAVGAEGTFEKTLAVSGPVELEIRTDSGSVTVRAGAASAIVVKGIIRTSRRWPFSHDPESVVRALQSDPPIRQSGNSIQIGTSIDPERQKHVSIEYDLLVPADTRLRAHSDSGELTIAGIGGPVDAEADSGSVRVSNIGGAVHAETDSGEVEVEAIQGNLQAQSDSGGIRARGIAGGIEASADSGGIHLQQTTAGPIRASSDSGSITVELTRAGYDISAQSDSGGIDTDVPLTTTGMIRRNRVEGKIRGGGPLVVLEADSGGIHIR
jgi:hypothetical protein